MPTDRSQHDAFASFTGPGAPYLHPTSNSFGDAEGAWIERTFVELARSLRSKLLHELVDLGSGRSSISRFTSRARGAIRSSYFGAYSLGTLSVFPFYTITARDLEILNDELAEETGFLRKFASDVAAGRLDLAPVQRGRLYLLGLRGIFERGRVEAMPAGPYRWQLGITEHCVECQLAAISGPYQRSNRDHLGLPPLPGSPGDGSVCLGLTRCGCTIVLASGQPLPNQDIVERLRGRLLEVANGSS